MRRRPAVLSGVLSAALIAGGYVTLDVYDVAPGVLTRDRPTLVEVAQGPEGAKQAPAVVVPQRPTVAAGAAVPLAPPGSGGGAPDAEAVADVLEESMSSRWLGPEKSVGVVVRDAATGAGLFTHRPDKALTPASTAKLLTAAAVASTLDLTDSFDTTVVRGTEPRQIVLVAGGDMLLAPGDGDPRDVSGRAGLADLAGQVADALPEQQDGEPVTLSMDLSYAAGKRYAPGWDQGVIDLGYTGPIAMLGLSTERATAHNPAPEDPVASTADAFRAALAAEGVQMADGAIEEATAPGEAEQLGSVSSAPIGEVLALALNDSDNALTESLARQAAFAAGEPTGPKRVAQWVVEQVTAMGIDTDGVKLADTSGLSDGSKIPVRVLGDLMIQATGNRNPALQRALARLPVGGLSGTLHDRFGLDKSAAGVGLARAKTGSLPGVTSLAGTVLTADGRLLVYAITAADIGPGGATLEARAAVDAIVADLAQCGCG